MYDEYVVAVMDRPFNLQGGRGYMYFAIIFHCQTSTHLIFLPNITLTALYFIGKIRTLIIVVTFLARFVFAKYMIQSNSVLEKHIVIAPPSPPCNFDGRSFILLKFGAIDSHLIHLNDVKHG